MKKERCLELDVARGLVILFVVFHHVANVTQPGGHAWYGVVSHAIRLYSMPVFFFMTGMVMMQSARPLASVRDYLHYCRRRLGMLTFIFFFFALVVFFGKWGVQQFLPTDRPVSGLADLWVLLLEPQNSRAGVYLWFLQVLFLYTVIWPGLGAVLRRAPWLGLGLTLGLSFIPDVPHVLSLKFALAFLPCLYAGSLLWFHKERYLPLVDRFWPLCLLAALALTPLVLNGHIPLLCAVVPLCPGFHGLCRRPLLLHSRMLELTARYMLPIYLLNTITINPLRGIILKFWTWDGGAFWVVLPLLWLVGVGGPMVIAMLLRALWERLRPRNPQPIDTAHAPGLVLRSALGLLTGRFCQPLFSFFLFWLCARALSLAEFGIYVLLMGLVLIFQVMCSLGLGQLLPRELGQRLVAGGEASNLDQNRHDTAPGVLTGAALALSLSSSALCYALLYGTARALQGPGLAADCCLILGLALPLSCAVLVAETAFIAYGKGKPLFLFNVAEQVTRTGLSALVLWLGYGLTGLMWAYVCGRGAACTVALLHMHARRAAVPRLPDGATLRRLARQLPVFAGMTVLATICLRTDILVLSWLADPVGLGIYGCAIRIVSICFIVPESISAAAYPHFSGLWAVKDASLSGKVSDSLALSLGLGLLAAAGLALFAPVGLPLIFGAKYAPSAPVLAVLGFMLPAYAVTVHLGLLLQAAGRERVVLVLVFAALVLLTAATVGGILAGGVMGVACGMVGAMWLLTPIYLRLSDPAIFHLPRPSTILRAGVVLVAGLCLIGLTRPQGPTLYALLVLCAGLSLSLSGLYRGMTPAAVRRALS